MKVSSLTIQFVAALSFLLGACGKDNYEAPSSKLTGRVTYNGQAVGVRGSNSSVRLQLWQDGFALRTPIDVFVTQDGSFSSTLFDGVYKLITVPGNGPWLHSTDTMTVQVNGDTQIEFPVRPYYGIANATYRLEGTQLIATFDVTQIDASRNIEEINLLVNDTKFVDLGHFTKRQTLGNAASGAVTVSMDLSDQLSATHALFARVGVKISGITEAVYDEHVEKIK